MKGIPTGQGELVTGCGPGIKRGSVGDNESVRTARLILAEWDVRKGFDWWMLSPAGGDRLTKQPG